MQMASLYIQLQQRDLLQLTPLEETNHHNPSTKSKDANEYTLLITLDHGIRLLTNNISQDLSQGSCILLPTQQSYILQTIKEQAHVVRLSFLAFQVDRSNLLPACPPLILGFPYRLSLSTIKLALAGEDWVAPSLLQSNKQNRLQEKKYPSTHHSKLAVTQARLQLILGLMAQLESAPPPVQSDQAVQRTLSYMEQHYYEDLTVEFLAEMAGMVRWQYSKLFKLMTGKKPTDYLTELRVQHAKRLLSSSTETLREISRQVGFKDEYYFSRRFHQLTGHPPREYANILRRTRQRTITDSLGRQISLPDAAVRIVATGTNTLGELLAIGIHPVGAGITTMKSQVIYRNKLHHIPDIGLQGAPEQVSLLKPDLILLGNYSEQQLPRLDAIAPTIVYRESTSTFERLRYIAGLFGRSRTAEQWIDRYEDSVRRIRRQLADDYIAGERATVYLVLGKNIYVMGQTGFAATLYESLGFRPTESVNQLIVDGRPWIQIDFNKITQYTGDRNFVMVPQEEMNVHIPSTLQSLVGMLAPSKVHIVEAGWNYDDPLTRERLLTVLPSIFAKDRLALVPANIKK
ncbi:AraC family transcriptional regulator [Paenibacillus xylanexedens]|uniref:AraC family transcriptional regulator n=1 Tax=Paenibacillus xylanexedens TaxID=528191 RepID=UPI0011A4D3C1|nr:AraC family transcriptional regulator [Paenibacillus xylanexedens]